MQVVVVMANDGEAYPLIHSLSPGGTYICPIIIPHLPTGGIMEQSTGRNKVTRHSPRPHGPSSRATSLSTLLIPQGYMQGRVDREPPAVECHPLFFRSDADPITELFTSGSSFSYLLVGLS